jgi:hypothetical protein
VKASTIKSKGPASSAAALGYATLFTYAANVSLLTPSLWVIKKDFPSGVFMGN